MRSRKQTPRVIREHERNNGSYDRIPVLRVSWSLVDFGP